MKAEVAWLCNEKFLLEYSYCTCKSIDRGDGPEYIPGCAEVGPAAGGLGDRRRGARP